MHPCGKFVKVLLGDQTGMVDGFLRRVGFITVGMCLIISNGKAVMHKDSLSIVLG